MTVFKVERIKLDTIRANLYCYTGSNKHIKIFLRYLDGGMLVTNLHSFLLPQAFRWPSKLNTENSLIRCYLSEIEDVLPAIPSITGLKDWKKNWKNFANNIYQHNFGLKKNQCGNMWMASPRQVLSNMNVFMPVLDEMLPYRKKLINNLAGLIEDRNNNKSKEIEDIINFAINKWPGKKITIFADHKGCSAALCTLEKFNDYVEKVYLLNCNIKECRVFYSKKVQVHIITSFILNTKDNKQQIIEYFGKDNLIEHTGPLLYNACGRLYSPNFTYYCDKYIP